MGVLLRTGEDIWSNQAVITTAASPLLSPWISTAGFTQVLPFFAFAGGTSVHSIQWSYDGATQDADFTATAPTLNTAFSVIGPYLRWSTVQTVADATKSKVCLMARQ